MVATLTAMAVLAAAVIASAQMMNMTGNDTQKSDQAVKENTDVTGMMNNMSSHWKMMSDSFGKLEDHFNSMMKMDNMAQLKKEMQKHHDMMSSMQQQMTDSRQVCSQMMSMMGSGNMQGNMMDSGNMMNSGGMHGGMMDSGETQGHMMGNSSGESSMMGGQGHNH